MQTKALYMYADVKSFYYKKQQHIIQVDKCVHKYKDDCVFNIFSFICFLTLVLISNLHV